MGHLAMVGWEGHQSGGGGAAWKQLTEESRVGTTDKVKPRPQCIEVSVTIGAEQEHGRKNKKGSSGIWKAERSRTLMTKSTAHSVLPGEDMSVCILQ